MPGIDIGDCGDKMALGGVDNGWCRFTNFRVPRESLLNSLGDVTPEGEYKTHIESEGKRFGLHFTSLGGGRVIISRLTNDFAFQALTQAIRFSMVRTQFGKTILDFPLHQFRLMRQFADEVANYLGSQRCAAIDVENITYF